MPVSNPVLVKDKDAVSNVVKDVMAAWADNDPDAFAARYTEDATIVTAVGGYFKGRDEIRSFKTMSFAGPFKGSKAIDEQEDIRFIGDSVAVVISKSGVIMAGETGVPAERMRRATWVLSKHDGDWWVEAFSNSPTTPA